MKSIIITISILLLSQFAFSQNWETIKYKDLVSFELPKGYIQQDTLGATIYQSEIEDTTYICSFLPDKTPLRFESKISIEAFYNDYFDQLMAKANNPTVIKKEMIDFGKFRALKATVQRSVIVKQLTWQMLVVHINNTACNFQCITQHRKNAQFDRLEKSIQFNTTFTERDQIAEPAAAPSTNRSLQYILYTVIGLAVIVGYYLYYRKKKK